ncbi:MAG: diphosphate--fructose-6-phosphate 1-phosphotransferase [Gammaproteobacteria bacterium]|nr:MAG: diphosphate--fructose-6-phosphate 1-phosphotransferase [Gammaproteobacteria bacterium]
MSAPNAFYAQSGGVTAVINATACGLLEAARKQPDKIGKVFAGENGIIGALNEALIDTSLESDEAIAALRETPGGAFGSCRYKLKSIEENEQEYRRLIEVFKAHNIRYFFYNGGGDSQDTAYKISQSAGKLGYPLVCIGIPKTVDNDLPFTDSCPGFGSVAKYVAISAREAALDVISMSASSTKVFVLEVMGRHAGWIAAAGGLADTGHSDAPQVILFPEIEFNERLFLEKIEGNIGKYGYCTVVASEGIRFADGKFVAESGRKDAFGHSQLGGVAPALVKMINEGAGHKCHWAVSDYLQRSARHIASAVDVEQAYQLGEKAVELALQGENAVMPTIVRQSDSPYRWSIGSASLADVANIEKTMPENFISEDGFSITDACRRYLLPLIQGESYPSYYEGLPTYIRLGNRLVEKKLERYRPS